MTRPPVDTGLYARSFVDVYDHWYADLHDLDQLVACCGTRFGAGATLLELGSGTGRIAAPLAAAGHRVVALDAALVMLHQDRSAARRVAADMVELPLADTSIDGALIAYNTLFNLETRERQQRCLEEVHRTLRPGGRLVVEAFIAPEDPDAGFAMSIVGHHSHPDGRMAIVTRPDPDAPHLITGAHIELRPDGSHSRPWRLAYQSPTELDASAARAGLEPVERFAGWAGEPFDPNGVRHVTWYRRPDPLSTLT